MLSSSFIVTQSPVLTSYTRSEDPRIYENTRLNNARSSSAKITPAQGTLNRTLRRSFSVGKYSDVGKYSTYRKTRSSSHSRECEPLHPSVTPMTRDKEVSPLSRRPLPEVPSPASQRDSPQRSLISDIYRFTHGEDSEADGYSQGSEARSRPRSRIPVSVSGAQRTGIKSRSVTQVDLRSELALSDTITKKGLLWIQQDKLFSSWKERFVILTNSHLQIFKKGTTKFSEMGAFINKISVSGLEKVTLEERRGYLTILLVSGPPHSVRLLLRRPDGLADWHRSILSARQGRDQRHRNFRRQLSEYGTFQNISRVSRSSVDSSPCSSIGRHYSSPPQAMTTENVYGAPPTRDQAVYGASDPVYELPLNSLPRFLQSPSSSRTTYTSSPSRLYERRTSVPRIYSDQNPVRGQGDSSPYGFTSVPLKLNQTMFL